jgi:hypothetical protein
MAKTLLYRLFGVGKIHGQLSATLQSEGVVLLDEGIPASVTYLDFARPEDVLTGGGNGLPGPSL